MCKVHKDFYKSKLAAGEVKNILFNTRLYHKDYYTEYTVEVRLQQSNFRRKQTPGAGSDF